MTDSATTMTIGRPEYRSALIGLAAANVVIILIMAILGGRFFVTGSAEIHGYIGNFIFLMVAVQAALVYVSKLGGPFGKLVLGLSLLALILVVGQIGLGYSSRTSINALSLHIPNGVLILGVSAAILAQLPHARRA